MKYLLYKNLLACLGPNFQIAFVTLAPDGKSWISSSDLLQYAWNFYAWRPVGSESRDIRKSSSKAKEPLKKSWLVTT
jgi:hypothetical protein